MTRTKSPRGPLLPLAERRTAVATAFVGRRTAKRLGEIEEILDMLVLLGQAENTGDGRYVAG